jgi:hypothetical protein
VVLYLVLRDVDRASLLSELSLLLRYICHLRGCGAVVQLVSESWVRSFYSDCSQFRSLALDVYNRCLLVRSTSGQYVYSVGGSVYRGEGLVCVLPGEGLVFSLSGGGGGVVSSESELPPGRVVRVPRAAAVRLQRLLQLCSSSS